MSSYLPPFQQRCTAEVITLTRRLFHTACAGVTLVTMTATLILCLASWHEAVAVTLNPGDILVADRQGNIIKIDPATGGQTVVNAQGVPYATGIAVEADGQILVTSFVCDGCGGSSLPSVIRLDPASGMWTVLTEGGLLQKPFGVAVEADGSILITDMARVIRVDPVTGDQTIFTSGEALQIAQGITMVPKKIKK